MSRLLEIPAWVNGEVLPMAEVLAPLDPDAHALKWRVLAISDVTLKSGGHPVEFEQRIESSPTGCDISFAELLAFAQSTTQVMDGLFVAGPAGSELPRRDEPDASILRKSELVVTAFDASYWLISAGDETLARMKQRFDDAVERDSASTPLTT